MLGSISPNPNLTGRDTQTPKGRGVFTNRSYRAGEILETSIEPGGNSWFEIMGIKPIP
jgi:hypothetical protein